MNAKAYLKQVKEAQRCPKEMVSANGIVIKNYGRWIFIPASLYEQIKHKLNETQYRKTVTAEGVEFKLIRRLKNGIHPH